jgi:hypothetical protein
MVKAKTNSSASRNLTPFVRSCLCPPLRKARAGDSHDDKSDEKMQFRVVGVGWLLPARENPHCCTVAIHTILGLFDLEYAPQDRLAGGVGACNNNEALWWDSSPSSPKAINIRGRFKNQLSIAFSA